MVSLVAVIRLRGRIRSKRTFFKFCNQYFPFPLSCRFLAIERAGRPNPINNKPFKLPPNSKIQFSNTTVLKYHRETEFGESYCQNYDILGKTVRNRCFKFIHSILIPSDCRIVWVIVFLIDFDYRFKKVSSIQLVFIESFRQVCNSFSPLRVRHLSGREESFL